MIAVVYSLKNEVEDLMREMKFRPLARVNKTPKTYNSKILKDTILVEGGIGHQRAEAATRKIIAELKPKAVLSVGFAAGTRPDVKTGDVVLCSKMLILGNSEDLMRASKQAEAIKSDESLLKSVRSFLEQSQIKYRVGDSLSTVELASSADRKMQIGNDFEVDIAEMESYWVCKTAAEANVPGAAIRVVLDTSDEDLSPFVAQSVESNGEGNVLKALRYMAVNPLRLKELMKLASQAKKAQRTLSSALISALNGLQAWEGTAARL